MVEYCLNQVGINNYNIMCVEFIFTFFISGSYDTFVISLTVLDLVITVLCVVSISFTFLTYRRAYKLGKVNTQLLLMISSLNVFIPGNGRFLFVQVEHSFILVGKEILIFNLVHFHILQ